MKATIPISEAFFLFRWIQSLFPSQIWFFFTNQQKTAWIVKITTSSRTIPLVKTQWALVTHRLAHWIQISHIFLVGLIISACHPIVGHNAQKQINKREKEALKSIKLCQKFKIKTSCFALPVEIKRNINKTSSKRDCFQIDPYQ